MCRFISFHHNPLNGDVVVKDLESHSDTERMLNLNVNIWREGHYLPNGEVELRTTKMDKVDAVVYKESFLNKWPTFASFFNWCMEETNQTKVYKGYLYLNSLTSAKDLKLPKEIGGGLYLSSLTNAKGLKLPEKIGGYLNLCSLKSARGLKMPEKIGGGLFVSDKVRNGIKT